MLLLSLVGLCMPSGCGKHMEQLVSPVVDLAVQSIREGPPNACKEDHGRNIYCQFRTFIIFSVNRICCADMPDEHPVMTTHRFPMRAIRAQYPPAP